MFFNLSCKANLKYPFILVTSFPTMEKLNIKMEGPSIHTNYEGGEVSYEPKGP